VNGSSTFERFAALGEASFASTRGGRDALAPFSRERFRALGRAGLFRVALPEGAGGEQRGLVGAIEALAGFAEASGDLGLATSALAQMVAVLLLARVAPPDEDSVAARWLPRLAAGHAIAAVANAEPGAGTNILALRARARPIASGWVLSARKQCITNAPVADIALVSARVLGADPRRSISCFAVEFPGQRRWRRPRADLPGLSSSPTGDLLLHRVEVRGDAVIGRVGDAVSLFKEVFALERLLAGALFLAAVARCHRRALDVAEAPSRSGGPLGTHQFVQERVLQMRVAADLLGHHLRETARAMDAGLDAGPSLSAVKIYGIEAAQSALTSLRRLLGSRGLSRADWTARLSEDLAVLAVFGGTVELHKRALYSDLVCEREQAAGQRIEITRVAPPPRGSPLEDELVRLVARAFPDIDRLRGRYTWDAAATHLFLARATSGIVGFRALFSRQVGFGTERVRALGMGIAIDPSWQRRGIGWRLTLAALEWASAEGHRLAVAFLASQNAETLLRRAGFRPLRARVAYRNAGGDRIDETAPCWIAALDDTAIVEAIEAHGELYVGDGTF
jgi:isovaleryl-CoA dehydrogenase